MALSTLPPGGISAANLADAMSTTHDKQEILNTLNGYFQEADANRKTGLNPRDEKWRQNLDMYWNRYDWSEKAAWQAKETMPEVPNYVDRFAAALKEALVSVPEGFYTVVDPNDPNSNNGDLTQPVKTLLDGWLSTSGRSQLGHTFGFDGVFEEQCKMGAMTAMCAVVLWKNDVPGGRVAVETQDPRFVWLDHTYRNLYRVRQVELDRVDLLKMANMTTNKGNALFNLDEMQRLLSSRTTSTTDAMMKVQQGEMSGSGTEVTSSRAPITLKEYVATIVGSDGQLIGDEGSLFLVADDAYILRGPEPNPHWHGKDWLVYAPMITAPLSVYGRSYMEDFGSVAHTFTELTNLLLDAVHTTSLNAFAMVPSVLEDPNQAYSGIHPNKTFFLQDGYRPEDFGKELNLGKLDRGGIEIWQALKQELSEAASINEIGLGQLPDKSHIAATAVNGAQQNSSAMVRSVANTIQVRFLEPTLDLMWKTGMQHANFDDPRLQGMIGPQWAQAFKAQRKEFVSRPLTFQARGITSMIQKSQVLQSLIQLLQILGASQPLAAAFLQEVDPSKLIKLLFNLSGIDPAKISPSQRDQMVRQAINPLQQAAGGAQPAPAGAASMQDMIARMGLGR
jgi:hypothetical protein